LTDPFAQNFPEQVVATLEEAALCVRYSPTGRFVAAGRFDGFTTVWDVETRGILRSMEGHVKGVISVQYVLFSCWIVIKTNTGYYLVGLETLNTCSLAQRTGTV
jgi:WD40 repeat protein